MAHGWRTIGNIWPKFDFSAQKKFDVKQPRKGTRTSLSPRSKLRVVSGTCRRMDVLWQFCVLTPKITSSVAIKGRHFSIFFPLPSPLPIRLIYDFAKPAAMSFTTYLTAVLVLIAPALVAAAPAPVPEHSLKGDSNNAGGAYPW
nr:hypothetical protein L203_00496 [Cryptococcus depauperatus CBS 7841]